MRQGTTPTHLFTLPFDISLVSTLQITYKQDQDIVLQKYKDDCVLDGDTVSVALTQEETFKFDLGQPVLIQLRVLTTEGNALASDVLRVNVRVCLDDEVLV